MYSLTLGDVAPKPFWPTDMEDGVRMSQALNGAFRIAIYLKDVTDEEEEIIASNIIKAKYLVDNTHSMLLTLMGYEGSDIIHEIMFDPTLYPKEEWGLRRLGWKNMDGILILLIDSGTGLLRSLRIENLPSEFKLLRNQVWSKALTIENYSNIYKQWIADAATFSVLQLWDLAQDAGYFSKN